MSLTTLRRAMAEVTVEHLGPQANVNDVSSYRATLKEHWPYNDPDAPVDTDWARQVAEAAFRKWCDERDL